MSSLDTAPRVARPSNASVSATPGAPRSRPIALVLLVVALVGVVAAAALVNQSRTPQGTIVTPPVEVDESSVGVDQAALVTDSAPLATSAAAPAPRLWVPAQITTPKPGKTVILRGLIENSTRVTVNGRPAVVEPGAFTAEILDDDVEVDVVAYGANGEVATSIIGLGSDRVPAVSQTVAVHVGLDEMSDPARWLPIVALAQDGKINAVQIDIKDEKGNVGYASSVPLANTIGAVTDSYDAADKIAELHDLNLRVIGRVVCFLDPKLGEWAWDAGKKDLVVQHPDGRALENDYGSAAFSNVANPEVRQYIFDLTEEAENLGFDEILFDYVRRPEGAAIDMVFPGITSSPTVAVAQFVRDASGVIDAPGVRFGISVFGISSTRPEEIGQDIRLMAPHVDYVAPMLYPALWAEGEYGVEQPWKTPGQIIDRSLKDFNRVMAGSGAAITPWLQDFDAGRFVYGEDQVREQIDAARWQSSSGFLVWNPNSTYDVGAFDPLN
jgi:hypothetical protein